jgi:integrase/recombinase XerD
MNGETISPLHRRMIEDMTVRKFVEKTQKDYIRHVKGLTIFVRRSPDTATAEDLRRYQLHLIENGARAPSVNSAVSALRFFHHARPARSHQAADLRRRATEDCRGWALRTLGPPCRQG